MGCVKSVFRYVVTGLIVLLSVTWQVGRMMLSTLAFVGLLGIWFPVCLLIDRPDWFNNGRSYVANMMGWALPEQRYTDRETCLNTRGLK